MKNLFTKTLLIGGIAGSLAFSGCGWDNQEKRIKYSVLDTLNGTPITCNVIKEKDYYSLIAKGNINNKYKEIHFCDDDNDSSLTGAFDYVLFYKNDYDRDISIRGNSIALGIWESDKGTEFYNAEDTATRIGKALIKEAKKQMENYFNPLYKKLRARAEEKYKKGIGIIPEDITKTKIVTLNQDSIINQKIKEFF